MLGAAENGVILEWQSCHLRARFAAELSYIRRRGQQSQPTYGVAANGARFWRQPPHRIEHSSIDHGIVRLGRRPRLRCATKHGSASYEVGNFLFREIFLRTSYFIRSFQIYASFVKMNGARAFVLASLPEKVRPSDGSCTPRASASAMDRQIGCAVYVVLPQYRSSLQDAPAPNNLELKRHECFA
jgi:hypothetical protein